MLFLSFPLSLTVFIDAVVNDVNYDDEFLIFINVLPIFVVFINYMCMYMYVYF